MKSDLMKQFNSGSQFNQDILIAGDTASISDRSVAENNTTETV